MAPHNCIVSLCFGIGCYATTIQYWASNYWGFLGNKLVFQIGTGFIRRDTTLDNVMLLMVIKQEMRKPRSVNAVAKKLSLIT